MFLPPLREGAGVGWSNMAARPPLQDGQAITDNNAFGGDLFFKSPLSKGGFRGLVDIKAARPPLQAEWQQQVKMYYGQPNPIKKPNQITLTRLKEAATYSPTYLLQYHRR